MPKHRIPLGTAVSFEGDSTVYETCDYQTVHVCGPDCDDDHDCFEEPYLCVKKTIVRSKPLSQLRMVFDQPHDVGRAPTPEELEVDQGE